MTAARLILLACVIIWGWSFVFTKAALSYVTPAELLGLRLLTGLPVQLAIILARRLRFDFTFRQYRTILIGSAIITAHFLIQITGIEYTSATNTGWIISVTPLVLAVLSYIFLREKVGTRLMAGILLATVGIFLLVSKGNLSTLDWLKSVGDWLVLVSAFTWAIYTVVTRDISRELNPLIVIFAILLPTLFVMMIYMLFTSDWSKFTHLPAEGVWSVLFLGVMALGLAHWFWQIGIARLGAARAGIFLYVEPVATTALAVPYLHESFGFITAAGGLLVLAGVYVAQNRKRSIA